jgi:hypothetical protein
MRRASAEGGEVNQGMANRLTHFARTLRQPLFAQARSTRHNWHYASEQTHAITSSNEIAIG